MSQNSLAQIERICREFASHPGEISVIVESKTDPNFRVSIDEDLVLPSASLIKIAIACAAAKADLDNLISLSSTTSVGELETTFYCSILEAFDPSDHLSLKALIGMMLIVSDNPATTAVLDAVGIERVNAWLADARLSKSNLSVGFNDDSLGRPLRRNLTTASDCLKLLKLVDSDDDYKFIKQMLTNNLRNERIPKRLPDDVIIAHKTGTLNGLSHDIAIIDSPSCSYYLILLADQLPEDANFDVKIARFSHAIYTQMTG